MCLLCNSALSDDNKLSIQNNNYIVPHKSAVVLIPSLPLSIVGLACSYFDFYYQTRRI